MAQSDIKLIMWDWNGTLQDDAAASHKAVNDMLARRDMPPINFVQYSSYIETPIIGFYRHIFDMDKIPFEVIAREFAEGFDLHMKGRGLMNGAKEALARAHAAGLGQVIVSSSEKNVLARYIESYGVRHYFDAVLASDDFEAGSKIDRARLYLEKNNIPAEQTVMVGDMFHDAEVADAVGAQCILIAKGHQTFDDLSKTGRCVVHDISEAIELIINDGKQP